MSRHIEPIRFNHTLRDGVQSLFGTRCSVEEILGAYANTHAIGTATIQTGGGTFFDLFAKFGRDEWQQVESIISHFEKKNVVQTALIRGDFLVSYKAQPFPVIKEFVKQYAQMGMNVFQNFHGLNDINALLSVAEAVRQVKDEYGYDIRTQGAICIEKNKNMTLDGCKKFAERLIETGHEGFYLKSASGVVDPYFVYRLTETLAQDFNQKIDVHIHSTYGVAPIGLMAAVEAGAENNIAVGIDVQHPAMSGSTAQPSMSKMWSLIKNHPNERVSKRLPDLNKNAIDADRDALHALRFKYRESEPQYNNDLKRKLIFIAQSKIKSGPPRFIPGFQFRLNRGFTTFALWIVEFFSRYTIGEIVLAGEARLRIGVIGIAVAISDIFH